MTYHENIPYIKESRQENNETAKHSGGVIKADSRTRRNHQREDFLSNPKAFAISIVWKRGNAFGAHARARSICTAIGCIVGAWGYEKRKERWKSFEKPSIKRTRRGLPVCRRLADKSIKRPNGKATYRRNSVAARLSTYRRHLCVRERACMRVMRASTAWAQPLTRRKFKWTDKRN